MMPHTIRAGTVEDASDIARVHVEGWRWAYRDIMREEFLDHLSVEERTEGWRRLLSDPSSGSVFVAVSGDEVVGFLSAGEPEHPADRAEGRSEIYAAYLLEEHTGRGIGRDLMLAAEQHLRSSGAVEAILWVLEENRTARRFYERGGWRPHGGTRSQPVGGRELTVVRYLKQFHVER